VTMNVPTFTTNDSWTETGWFKIPSDFAWLTSASHCIASAGQTNGGWGFWCSNSENKVEGGLRVGDNYCTVDFAISRDTWYYFAVTYTSNDRKVRLYINGVYVNASNAVPAGTYTLSNVFNICRSWVLGGTSGGYVKAMVDDIHIYNRILSAGEIQYLYTKTQARYK
jgi:hypothetical protein